MSHHNLVKGAKLVVNRCVGIKSGENVVIITDEENRNYAKALATETVAKDARLVLCDVTSESAPMKANPYERKEPPKNLAAVMKNSDVILILALRRYSHMLFHTDARREAIEAGARYASVDERMEEWTVTEKDLKEIVHRTEVIGRALGKAKKARVTSTNGTNIVMSIQGREPKPIIPIVTKKGSAAPVPNYAECAIAPVEDSANGKVIVDTRIQGLGYVSSPVELTFKNGRVINAKGGTDAEALEKILGQHDDNANILCELGVGTTHMYRPKMGWYSDMAAWGTIHLALGDNHTIGGKSVSNMHIDCQVANTTLELDGRVLVRGNLLVG